MRRNRCASSLFDTNVFLLTFLLHVQAEAMIRQTPFKLAPFLSVVTAVFKDRADLVAENMVLRHQLSCLLHRGPRPRLRIGDHRFAMHAQAPSASGLAAAMGNVLAKSSTRDPCSRFRCRAHGNVWHSLRVLCSEPRAPASTGDPVVCRLLPRGQNPSRPGKGLSGREADRTPRTGGSRRISASRWASPSLYARTPKGCLG